MSFSIGVDIIEIDRIKLSIDKYGQRFLDKIFTSVEQEYCLRFKECERQFAGRFAAKEACVKALGTGINHQVGWKDIEIVSDPRGKPQIVFREHLFPILKNRQVEISISHCKLYATATALLIPHQ
jgi:holo-[acyl-carrier protein] synthase